MLATSKSHFHNSKKKLAVATKFKAKHVDEIMQKTPLLNIRTRSIGESGFESKSELESRPDEYGRWSPGKTQNSQQLNIGLFQS